MMLQNADGTIVVGGPSFGLWNCWLIDDRTLYNITVMWDRYLSDCNDFRIWCNFKSNSSSKSPPVGGYV